MADTPFAHLHVHTEYSMLDGAARLKEMFKEVKANGMTHVAMTDHGNMFGAAEFHRQAKDAGITPVIGIEAYVAPEFRGNKSRILWGQPHQKSDDVSASGAYLRKVPAVVCNKRVIESLVKAGAFDSFSHPRKGLVLIHEQAVDSVIDIKRNEAIGQDSLFGGDEQAEAAFEVAIPDTEWDKKTRLNFEREMLGLYVSDHPLLGIEHLIANGTDISVAELMATGEDTDDDEADRPPVFASTGPQGGRSDGQIVKIGGILSGVTRKVTKKGDAWAAATLEDLGGAIEVLFFPNSYQLYATAIADDAIVIVKGKVDKREDVPKLIAMDMTIPDLTMGSDGSTPIVLQLPVTKCVPPVVEQLRDVLRTHPGTTEVHLRLRGNQKTTVVRLDDKLRVTPGPALQADLKQLLGPSCIAS
jgi:DNA polymerase-3 subunit alpha